MTTSRLLRTSRTAGFGLSSSSSNSSQKRTVRCPLMSKDDREKRVYDHHNGMRPSVAAPRASMVIQESVSSTEQQVNWDMIRSIITNVGHAFLTVSKMVLKQKAWRLHIEIFTETAIVSCRFFTLLAIAGSLVGSVLCFVEGCFFVLESYFQYFRAVSHRSDEGQVLRLLIEALDMFLLGTAMIIIGVGFYNMFVRSKSVKKEKSMLNESKSFGISYSKAIPNWAEMQSIFQANLKIGHALMLILQVGVLEKFKSVPLVTGCDLACFAGALLLSTAATFVLSKVSSTMQPAPHNRITDSKKTPCILV